MDIELNVIERLALLQLLPNEGNLLTLRIVRQLREDLSFDEAEHAALQFRQEGDQLRWNVAANEDKAVPFGAKAMQLIQDKLGKMNDEGKLREEHLSLCDKFSVGE